jgi:8-amino-7-oxononanoate synthase
MGRIKEIFNLLVAQIKGEDYKMQRIFEFTNFLKNEGIAPTFYNIKNAATEPEVILNGKKVLMFSSNNYLGLSMHPTVIKGAQGALQENGIGPGGSRFLCGNINILNDLDKATAELAGSEDSVTLPTGYMANVAIFKALMDPIIGILPYRKGEGIIFSDEFNHGSMVDGSKLSYAKKVIFRHNDLKDLELKLKKVSKRRHKIIVTEGVFSPWGELSPLPSILDLSKKYNAILMIDDAHGIGVLGENGGGAIEHFGLRGQIDIVMGSFDKAFGGMGGFLATNKKLAEYLRFGLRTNILSSAVPGVLAGGLLESIKICRSEEGKNLRYKLFENANYLRIGFEKMGFKVLGNGEIPVIPVLIGNEAKSIKLTKKLLEYGIYSPSFRWPAVPKGQSRMRITPMATHKKEHLDALLGFFKKAKNDIRL